MILKLNGVKVPVLPKSFMVTTMDLDDGDTTTRSANGTLNRDRVAVKRQIEIEWGPLSWANMATILQLISNTFFDVYYPDPQEYTYVTKIFYAANRPCPVAREMKGQLLWQGLKVTLIER